MNAEPTCSVPSTISVPDAIRTIQAMPETLSSSTPLPSVDACRAVIAAYENGQKAATHAEAVDLTHRLIGCYPQRGDMPSAEVYTGMVTAAFAGHPPKVGRAAIERIVTTCRFLPTIADLTTALETERRDRANLWARARWALDEHERRERKRKEDARFELTPERIEQRRAFAEKALADFLKPKRDDKPKPEAPAETLDAAPMTKAEMLAAVGAVQRAS